MKVYSTIGFCLLLLFDTAVCGQDMEQSAASDINSVQVLPFTLSEANNIIFEVVLNETDSIKLFFDTGGTELVLRHDAIKKRTSLLAGKNESYQGEDYEALDELNSLRLGELTWDSLAIYPVGVGPLEADGHFGWDLFEGMIVELDYDKLQMIIHEKLPERLDEHAVLEMEFTHTLFCVESTLLVNGQSYPSRYLFDTGFQRSVILDKDLRLKDEFPTDLEVIKESKLKNGAGEVFVNKVVEVDQVCFAESCAFDVPIQLFSTPNPARFETHILGNEILKRFNTILDFQEGNVYMKENSLMNEPYTDSSGG